MYKPVEFPEELKQNIMKELDYFNDPESAAFRKNIYFSRYYPPFQYFFSDDVERLFVMTHEKGKIPGQYRYDIFNSDGIFIGRTSIRYYQEEGFSEDPLPAKARNKRLYCLREKDSGYKELVVHKMRWE